MRKRKDLTISIEKPKPRYPPDPHRRGRVIPDKTKYDRKTRDEQAE